MFRVCALLGIVALLGGTAPQPSFAQDRHGGHEGGHNDGQFDGGRVGANPGAGVHAWHGGNWRQGWHNGRSGWWWVVPGSADWYYYDAPTYPYPDPYTPPGVASAGPGYWYYCASPPGYFPYVAQCALPWQPVVPPTPPG